MSTRTQAPAGPNDSQGPDRPPAGNPADPQWAWAPYEPDDNRPWNLALAGHLYRRAAFGADGDQLQQAVADGPQRAVEMLVSPQTAVADFHRSYDGYEASANADALRAWWLRRMIQTPHPLLEKMTLFWHNHFAATGVRVNNAPMMRDHVQLLREHALGSYPPLLEAVSRDPALLVSVGADENRKAVPNENYARELMARFSLGPGNFMEEDIREAARAFTGWRVLRNQLRYFPADHDPGVKRILGREGKFDGDDVVEIVLQEPATPRLLVRKLYRWLVSETDEPSEALVVPLAESFAKDYDVAKLVETILRSNLFFSPAAYRQRIKGPVEFALGIVRGLEGMVPTANLGNDLAALGQNLYRPPTVKGWEGGRFWLNGATLVGRSNLAAALLSGAKPYGEKLDPLAVAGKHGHATPEAAARFLVDLFLQGDLDEGVAEALSKTATTGEGSPAERLRRFAHAVVTLPEFQLA
ncbi:MAG TPA: DUF1800 domain-containing protein [Thermoguttaceae bacterium]|nr:DUF1800 domain-containing protein [Thermoguttaceae bacterium]